MTSRTLFLAVTLLATAAPAMARHRNPVPSPAPAPAPAPTPVPETGDAGLLLLGVIGVAAGRWMNARRARTRLTERAGQ